MTWRNGLRAALVAPALIAVSASPGFAAAPALPAAKTFAYAGAEQTYTVPAKVTMVQAEAVGAPGQTASIQPGPGDGLDLSVGLPVTPGEALFAEVGAPNGMSSFGGGGAGGIGTGATGGAGGGASDVRTCSIAAVSCPGGANSAATRLLVAGGGGGSGGAPLSSEVDLGAGCGENTGGGSAAPEFLSDFMPIAVPGGTALPGADDNVQTASGDTPATGGAGTAAGTGGTIAGCSGAVPLRTYSGSVAGSAGGGAAGGAGGSGPGGGGGGGGGGYFGGGGGASGQSQTAGPHPGSVSDGSGGAAGSSFFAHLDTGNISYQGAGRTPPEVVITPLIVIASPAPGASFAQRQTVHASYACLDGCVKATVASGSTIDTSKPGKHTFQVGDQAQSHPIALSTVSYTVTGTKAPTVKITAVAISKHDAKFTFAARSGRAKSFLCALQQAAVKHAAAFAKCTSPKSYRGLKPGSYIFSVRAVGAGVKSAAATHHFSLS